MKLTTPAPRQRIADSLKVFTLFGVICWWPWTGVALPWPLSWIVREYDLAGVFLFFLWLCSPFLASIGLIFLPRDFKVRLGWLQVSLGLILYASLWWRLSQIEI